MPHTILTDHIRPILGAIRSVPVPAHPLMAEQASVAVPFITISREPGAGGWSLARHLVDALNIAMPAEQPWTCWDKELVEKVAEDLHLSKTLIDSLEDRGHSWLSDFFESLSMSDAPGHADDARIYSRVAATVRALAQTGRVVIVGRGGVFITRKMAGGIHVRLVAPFQNRAAMMAREYHLQPDQAAANLKELEHRRNTFFRHYWPNDPLTSDRFTVTINTASVDQPTMVEMLTVLVRRMVAGK